MNDFDWQFISDLIELLIWLTFYLFFFAIIIMGINKLFKR